MRGFFQPAPHGAESYLTQRASRRTAPRHAVHRRTCSIAAGAVQPTSCCAATSCCARPMLRSTSTASVQGVDVKRRYNTLGSGRRALEAAITSHTSRAGIA